VSPGAVEELGEIQIEVGEEGVHPDHVGEGDAGVAAVLLHSRLQRPALASSTSLASGNAGALRQTKRYSASLPVMRCSIGCHMLGL